MNRTRILSAILALGALLAAAPAPAQFTIFRAITTDPALPAVGDTVIITVSAEMQDSCWSLLGHACADTVAPEIVIAADTYDCADRECGSCMAVPVPFEVSCQYVFETAGSYTIRAVENADTGRGGFHYDFERVIEVAEEVPAATLGWSALKSMYR